jgi:hypothetical protein
MARSKLALLKNLEPGDALFVAAHRAADGSTVTVARNLTPEIVRHIVALLRKELPPSPDLLKRRSGQNRQIGFEQ